MGLQWVYGLTWYYIPIYPSQNMDLPLPRWFILGGDGGTSGSFAICARRGHPRQGIAGPTGIISELYESKI
jgi:hypothetical protein